MKIKFESESNGGDEEDVLVCPVCSFNYLHQCTVNVFEQSEGSKDSLHIRVDHWSVLRKPGRGSGVYINNAMHNNPSPARQGLIIQFWCENCHKYSDLKIYQQKGETFIGWGAVS